MKSPTKFHPDNQRGSVLLAFVIMLPFLILIGSYYIDLSVSSFSLARRGQLQTHAQVSADAGVDYAMQQINLNDSWAGTGGEVQLMPTTNGVRTTYDVTVADTGTDEKTISSTGRSYRNSSTTPESSITVEAILRPVSSGEYSVVSGVGGLIMSNNSKILGGDVLINGKVTLSNSAQIGLSTNPVTLEVAHYTCPPGSSPGSSYPRYCNSGEDGQPISLSNSARIYGTVKANNQTSGTGMSSPGLQTPHCLVSGGTPSGPNCITAQPLPPHDRDAQKAAVSTTLTGGAAGCSSGTKSWPANLKITGDVSISNSCKLTVNGNVWITGRLTVSNSADMIVANSLGTTRPVVMVDGTKADFVNSAELKSNTSNTGFMIINYMSDAACSPDCPDVTGNDLYNSRNDERIELSNSSEGPNTIFYARWTKVKVSNSGQIGALVGQTVDISNSGTITFGTSTGTGTSFWVIDSVKREF